MATTFEVIAEPSRRRILDLLRRGEMAVNDLVAELDLSQPGVSKHLRILREAGLVRARHEGPRRVYRIDHGPLLELEEWLTPFRAIWAERLDDLEAHLDTMEEE